MCLIAESSFGDIGDYFEGSLESSLKEIWDTFEGNLRVLSETKFPKILEFKNSKS